MADRTFGRVRVVLGAQNGKYPYGNSLWITGSKKTAVVDPSLSLVARNEEFAGRADLVLLSHTHEDHVAGVGLFPDAIVHAHTADLLGIQSLDGLMEIYGYAGAAGAATRDAVLRQFHYTARPDAVGCNDDTVFDLGDVRVRFIHAPGHTRGHCVLRIEPEDILFLGDIELSSFGPYYGDAWSDLADFERSIELVRNIEAQAWVSFHHVGVIDDRSAFLARLERFAARIAARESALLAFLDEPRSIEEMVAHRFLYPQHATLPFVDAVERRTIEQHLARLHAARRIERVEADRWHAGAAGSR